MCADNRSISIGNKSSRYSSPPLNLPLPRCWKGLCSNSELPSQHLPAPESSAGCARPGRRCRARRGSSDTCGSAQEPRPRRSRRAQPGCGCFENSWTPPRPRSHQRSLPPPVAGSRTFCHIQQRDRGRFFSYIREDHLL